MTAKKLIGLLTSIAFFILLGYVLLWSLPMLISLGSNLGFLITLAIIFVLLMYAIFKFLKWCFN